MTTTTELREQLDRLRTSRAAGVREVQNGDERVVYQNDRDLAAAIADLERQIAAAEGRRVHTVRVGSSKGF
ncbi:gpW family head-tail joining protein [Pseudoxanthobacter sp. M-2]|uniref:phage head-tail joining protein n=1 Tax=Pseudoxanthobacter sp. M-2 TaxID=3078754 RepID=UPI0038FC6900